MLAVIASDGRELEGVRRHGGPWRRLRWPVEWAWKGELNGQPVVLVADGPGGPLAAGGLRTAWTHERVTAVLSAGWCGALDPRLAPGDILVISRVGAEGGGPSYPCEQPGAPERCRSGWLVTAAGLAATAAEKARLRAGGAAAVDMEAVHLAADAAWRGLKFYCVRVVLDALEEDLELDLEAAREENGRLSKLRIVRAALSRPRRGVPELARWVRRSRETARALGAFLAECTFDA